MDEIWKDIEGYEGLYQGSNLGRVRSLDIIVNGKNNSKCLRKGRILKPGLTTNGYQHVDLCNNGKKKTFLVHRLVYATFYGEIPEGMQVNHINEDKTDNRLCNLNLMTCKENVNYGTGIARCRKANINHQKKSKQVVGYDEQGNISVTFPSIAEAGRNGYNSWHISSCCRGVKPTHKGLTWKYNV